ncbi:uncharacterized protein BT62DRAFT_94308 [Guyanagaster necrorhizus]|uniref:Uncharacterized protein n=1 Tax=Guyanagaster necrorhizus TaxID=856835 RepID=A0A9P8AT05_9AGAR|nr:uncharacterized protein BT62DRAFT_94308 [Guyanagaster necrorhizus MCA 3950]KAG7446943.1 hypothetical protein BT62DRAFT_94308 [Guyanagaster necrorhizus MCA 3950]
MMVENSRRCPGGTRSHDLERSRFHILSRDMSIVLDNHNSRDSNSTRVGIGSPYPRVWSSEAHPGMNRDRVRERVWLGEWRTTCGLLCAALGRKPVQRSASTKARWTRPTEPLGIRKAQNETATWRRYLQFARWNLGEECKPGAMGRVGWLYAGLIYERAPVAVPP